MAVDVQTEPTFAAGNPEVVFEGRYSAGPFGRTYDIAPDGERFLISGRSSSAEGEGLETGAGRRNSTSSSFKTSRES